MTSESKMWIFLNGNVKFYFFFQISNAQIGWHKWCLTVIHCRWIHRKGTRMKKRKTNADTKLFICHFHFIFSSFCLLVFFLSADFDCISLISRSLLIMFDFVVCLLLSSSLSLFVSFPSLSGGAFSGQSLNNG